MQPLISDPAPSRGFVLTKPYVVQVEHRQDTKVAEIKEQLLMVLTAENSHALLSKPLALAVA